MPYVFRQRDEVAPAGEYRLLPFRFMRWSDDEVLVTNDVGEFVFVSAADFAALCEHRLNADSVSYANLRARHILDDAHSQLPLDLLATKYRTKKSFLEGFTSLHMFVVTLRCNHSCHYCQVSRVSEDRARFDMDVETADRAIALMLQSPAQYLKVEFQGGEPLLNVSLIKHIVLTTKAAAGSRKVEFVIATNLSVLDDDVLEFCATHGIQLSTSLDGPAWLHDANRPFRGSGSSSHSLLVQNLERARSVLGHEQVSALMTTTQLSLDNPEVIIDEYVRLGFSSVFLRAISPYGFAVKSGKAWEYSEREFLEFYRRGLQHVIQVNRAGTRLVETYSQILLRRMLTPFGTGYVDLQSPCGAGINAVAYNYDGEVYPSDEARMLAAMGDKTFLMGNARTHSFSQLFGGPVVVGLQAASVVEVLPGCSDCAFAPYCGADPVYHWAVQRDPIGHRPTSGRCHKHMGMFRHLFTLMRSGDEFVRDLFTSWAVEEG